MESLEKLCIHCLNYRNEVYTKCATCSDKSNFSRVCFYCLNPVGIDDIVCLNCGKFLYIECPNCKQMAPVSNECVHCGTDLLVECPNPECGNWVYYQNAYCPYCNTSLN